MLQRVFRAAGGCVWDGLKINYGAHVHRQKETCQPVNQCVSLMCFFNSISTTLEVGGAKGMSYIRALPTQLTVVGGIIF